MTTDLLREWLAWSLVLNYVVLLLWFVVFVFARDKLLQLHARWFRLAPAQFDAVHYAGMAAYKIGILLFNLVPYVALCILAR